MAKHMKKIGFMQLYNEAPWVEHAINQAMLLCDKLIIAEGSQFANFPNLSERSDDGTLDLIDIKMIEWPGRIELVNTIRKSDNYRVNQCANFNNALKACDPGDIFIPLDADEFYSDKLLLELPRLMEEIEPVRSDAITIDRLTVPTQLYAFGFASKLYMGQGSKDVFFRVTKDFHFTPTHNPHKYGNNHVVLAQDYLCHHYTWVKTTDRMRVRFQTSGMYPNMLKWFDDSWSGIKLGDTEFRTYKGDYATLRYDSTINHPTLLKNHIWRNIKDVRYDGQ